MESYRTVFEASTGEYEEKRSRFIGALCPVSNEDEAMQFISEIRSQNREARHNVHAFVIKENGISRFSDDGEPHGTAGKPVLDVINGAELKNVCLVVTRYFGGILLGTGGLCRAYSAAAKAAVEAAKIVTMQPHKRFVIECDYQQYNRLAPFIEKSGGTVEKVEYTEKVTVTCYFKAELCEKFLDGLREMFSGNLVARCVGEDFAPVFLNF